MKALEVISMAEFVNFKVPEDLKNLQSEVLAKVVKTGKIKIGINEVTKIIERNTAKLVVIAEDVSPAEIIMHVPVLCKEKKVPFTYVQTREELGKLAGIGAKASSIVVMDEGVAKKEFSSLVNKINEVVGGKKEEPKTEKPKAEKKEKPKAESVKAEKKEEPKAESVKAEKKEEPKAEAVKAEKKEEPKAEAVKAEKKEEPKAESVKEEKKEEQ
jgi:large subunit ribosomal protein L7Ae